MSQTPKTAVISKKRRRMLPPRRLDWPEDIYSINLATMSNALSNAYESTTTQNTSINRFTQPIKQMVGFRRKKVEELWIEKFSPKSTKELCVAPQKVKEVEQWLSDTSMCKLLILIGSPGVGKSTMIKVLAKSRNMNVLEWSDTQTEYSFWNDGHSFGNESQISSFQEFIDAVAFQYQSVDDENPSNNGSIVLIDELPYMHDREKEEEFRKMFSAYVTKTQSPTVLVFSDVCEGKHKPEDLERYLEREVLYSPIVKVMQINQVTQSKMKSCLRDILKKEGILSSSKSDLDTYIQELHSLSEGDIRHAIMQLQFFLSFTHENQTIPWNSYRDTKFSTFHSLGKLLYAKRVQEGDDSIVRVSSDVSFYDTLWNTDHRPPLQFVPEDVLYGGDIGIDGALAFLQYHSSDFYTDIGELSNAFEIFSDAAYLLGTQHEERTDYAISLCSRSVAHTNRHPAPSKFRQLNAPRVYEVFRKIRETQTKYDQICKRVSQFEDQLKLDINIRNKTLFAIDFLPYMKLISPDDVYPFLGDLYAHDEIFLRNIKRKEDNLSFTYHNSALAKDDIVDSDDDVTKEMVTNTKQSSAASKNIKTEIIVIDSDSE